MSNCDDDDHDDEYLQIMMVMVSNCDDDDHDEYLKGMMILMIILPTGTSSQRTFCSTGKDTSSSQTLVSPR